MGPRALKLDPGAYIWARGPKLWAQFWARRRAQGLPRGIPDLHRGIPDLHRAPGTDDELYISADERYISVNELYIHVSDFHMGIQKWCPPEDFQHLGTQIRFLLRIFQSWGPNMVSA